MLDFFNRFIVILSQNPIPGILMFASLALAFFIVYLLLTTKSTGRDILYILVAFLAFNISIVTANNYKTEKVIETSSSKQIYSNKENINLTLEPNQESDDRDAGLTSSDPLLELLKRQNLKDLTAGQLASYNKADSLTLRAAKDDKEASKTVYLKNEDIQNPSKRKDAKLARLEIYKETIEVIHLFETKRKTKTYIKPSFEVDKDIDQLEQFLEP